MTLWAVDLVLVVLAAEVMLLALWRRRWFIELAPHLAAGLMLVLALRSLAAGDSAVAVTAWLAAAGLAHGAAVWRTAFRSPA